MKRPLVLAIFAFAASISNACCITFDKVVVNLTRETAILIWDQEGKVEHFIRSALFEGKANDFGFIFPSPTEPFAIEVADRKAFDLLERLKPRDPEPSGGTKSADSAAGGVDVLQQKLVGDFEATVLKATDGTAMGDWLKKNGHQMRPAMTPWLDHYSKQGWYFTAFKYLGKVASKPTEAVRVSFRTDKPHYPYKMPSDTWPSGHHRPLSLFVVSQSPVKGAYTDAKPWETSESWHGGIDSTTLNTFGEAVGTNGKPLDLPGGLIVTRFENVPEATNYDSDLTFEAAPDPPYVALWLALGALLTAGYAFLRKKSMPDDQNLRPRS